MEPPTASLTTMPSLVLDKILDKAGWKAIYTLRRTSRAFYDYINEGHPESKFTQVGVESNPDKISIKLTVNMYDFLRIEYKKHEKGCMVIYGKKSKLLKGEDFATTSGKDFGMLLQHQKTLLKRAYLSFIEKDEWKGVPLFDRNKDMDGIAGRFINALKPYLKSREKQIKIEFITIEGANDQRKLMKVIPYLDPDSLDEMYISYPKNENKKLEIDEIAKLEQWKKCVKLESVGFVISTSSLKHFNHFSRVELDVKAISVQELAILKEELIASPTFVQFDIFHKNIEDEKKFPEIFGEPYEKRRYRNDLSWLLKSTATEICDVWQFKIPNTDYGVEVCVHKGKCSFLRIEMP